MTSVHFAMKKSKPRPFAMTSTKTYILVRDHNTKQVISIARRRLTSEAIPLDVQVVLGVHDLSDLFPIPSSPGTRELQGTPSTQSAFVPPRPSRREPLRSIRVFRQPGVLRRWIGSRDRIKRPNNESKLELWRRDKCRRRCIFPFTALLLKPNHP
jgi:hypothetical protein